MKQAIVSYILAALLSASFVLLLIANADRSEAQDRIKKLEGELAVTRSNLYDLQWKNDAEIEDTNNQQVMAMSVLQWKLDKCLKGEK